MQQAIIRWTLSMRQTATWRNSFLQKFENAVLYWLEFKFEDLKRKFLCLGVNLMIVRRIRKELDETTNDYPVHIIVFWIVTNNNAFIHLPRVLNLNIEGFIKYLEDLVFHWIERVIAGRPNVGQQDCATSPQTFGDSTPPRLHSSWLSCMSCWWARNNENSLQH